MIDADAIAARLEAAAFDPGSLPGAFQAAGRDMGFAHMFLLRIDPGNPGFVGGGDALGILEDYAEGGWWRIDDRLHRTMRCPDTMIMRDHLFVTEEVRRKSQIYNDFYAHHNVGWNAGWRTPIAGEMWAFSLLKADGPVGDEEADALARLAPAVNRSVKMGFALHGMYRQGVADGLAASGAAAVVLDNLGQVCLVTPEAERLFGPDFCVSRGRMRVANAAGARDVGRLEAAARSPLADAPIESFAIQRSGGRRPLLAHPVTVRGHGLDMLPGMRVIVMLVDLEQTRQAAPDVLRALFGLSPTEADIAILLGRGLTVAETADARGVLESTVRDQLKGLYARMGVNRQSEVVRIVDRISRLSAGETPPQK